MGAKGTTAVDFGAFPGTTDATATVTGQTGILAGSLVEAWILPANTAVHSIDEHIILTSMVSVVACNITAGVGFEIRVLARDQGGSPLEAPGGQRNHTSANAGAGANLNRGEFVGSVGGQTINTIWGTINVAWVWD